MKPQPSRGGVAPIPGLEELEMKPLKTIAQTGCKIIDQGHESYLDWFHVKHISREDSVIAGANFRKMEEEIAAYGETSRTPATPQGVVLIIPPDVGEDIKERLSLLIFMAGADEHILCEQTYHLLRSQADAAHWQALSLYERLLICRRADIPPRQALISPGAPDRARRILHARPLALPFPA
jgi:hypothetical protein